MKRKVRNEAEFLAVGEACEADGSAQGVNERNFDSSQCPTDGDLDFCVRGSPPEERREQAEMRGSHVYLLTVKYLPRLFKIEPQCIRWNSLVVDYFWDFFKQF